LLLLLLLFIIDDDGGGGCGGASVDVGIYNRNINHRLLLLLVSSIFKF
jgi:hypothetical protein